MVHAIYTCLCLWLWFALFHMLCIFVVLWQTVVALHVSRQDPTQLFSCPPLTSRLSLLIVTTILVSSHCTLRSTLRPPWCSSGAPFPQGPSSREEGWGTGGGKGKGRPECREAAPAPGWGLEPRRIDSSGGKMLSRGSTTSESHKLLEAHEVDFTD